MASTTGDHAVIDHSLANGRPGAILFVAHGFNPAGTGRDKDRRAREEGRADRSYFAAQSPKATPPGAATIAIQPMAPGSSCGGSISTAPAASEAE